VESGSAESEISARAKKEIGRELPAILFVLKLDSFFKNGYAKSNLRLRDDGIALLAGSRFYYPRSNEQIYL